MYLISIIMPIYNAEKYLTRTINSLINQTIGFDNIELILVDDNSSDSSRDIIKEFSDKFPNIISFFSEINHGFPGYGRNVGIENATAKYIMFIDNDDEYEPDFCEIVYNVIENFECDIVSTNYSILEDDVVKNVDIFSLIDSKVDSDDIFRAVENLGRDVAHINFSILEEEFPQTALKVNLVETNDKLNKFKYIVDITIWTKIFKKSIILENNIKFVEDRLNEDSQFIYNYYYYVNDLIHIDYYGYKHHRDGENLSYFSSKSTLGFINSYYDLFSLVEEKYGAVDMDYLFKCRIELSLYRIMLSSHQRCLLEKLYEFENKIGFNSPLSQSWATFCNKLLLKQKYSLLLVIFKILKLIKNMLDFLRSKKILK